MVHHIGRGSPPRRPTPSKSLNGRKWSVHPLNFPLGTSLPTFTQATHVSWAPTIFQALSKVLGTHHWKQRNWHSTSSLLSRHFSWVLTLCLQLCSAMGTVTQKLAWHMSNRDAVGKYNEIRKRKLFRSLLSYLVTNWRWRRSTWKGHIRLPRQRKRNPTSCPAETSGWPHCVGSLTPLHAGSGWSSCRSAHRSAPLPRQTWRRSGKTWLQNTQHRSHRIQLDP